MKWLNPKQLEKKYGISISNQAKLRSKKLIPYHKIGRYIFYNIAKIDNWINEHEIVGFSGNSGN